MELWIDAGCQGDETTLWVCWHDQNNARRVFPIRVKILAQDKPRSCVVEIRGSVVYRTDAVGAPDPRDTMDVEKHPGFDPWAK